MNKSFYTLMLIPPSSKGVKKWAVSSQGLRNILYGVGSVFIFVLLSGVFTYKFFSQRAEMKEARAQVIFLENNLKAMQNRLAAADATLGRIQNFEQKLRVITRLEDSSRNLAVGPLSKLDKLSARDRLLNSKVLEEDLHVPEEYRFEVKETNIRLSEVHETASLREQTMHELYEMLQDQKALLSHTPSVWPAKGWTTSHFGYRPSPFTGRIQMHEGLDIAARIGTPVIAPANGTVVRVVTYEGYGKMIVVDHGYGIVTRYGHNSEILVDAGDKIKRGDVIAKVGNTGVSTGPHLHYEIRVNGVPVDPMKYILD